MTTKDLIRSLDRETLTRLDSAVQGVVDKDPALLLTVIESLAKTAAVYGHATRHDVLLMAARGYDEGAKG